MSQDNLPEFIKENDLRILHFGSKLDLVDKVVMGQGPVCRPCAEFTHRELYIMNAHTT